MYIIVVGCGRVGAKLAELLSNEGHNVVVIDKDPNSFARLGPAFNGSTVVGNGFDKDALAEAGVDKADAFAAVTNRDNTNIMAAQVAKGIYKIPRVIARIYDPGREKTYFHLGLDVIGGTTLIARLLKDKITQTTYSTDTSAFGNGDVKLINFLPSEEIIGKSLNHIDKKNEFKIIFVKNEKGSTIVEKDYIIKKKDRIHALVKSDKIKKYLDYFAKVEISESK